MFMCLLTGYTVCPRGFTVDGSRNQAGPQTLSVPASPVALLSLFLCAADMEIASRPGNFSTTPVCSVEADGETDGNRACEQ